MEWVNWMWGKKLGKKKTPQKWRINYKVPKGEYFQMKKDKKIKKNKNEIKKEKSKNDQGESCWNRRLTNKI